MPEAKTGRETDNKGICTDRNKSNMEVDFSTSETDSGWKSPNKLKQEVQTIIDIMGPSLSPNFNNNTSSEADNEESYFTNSKLSSEKMDIQCKCNDHSEKTDDTTDVPSKDEPIVSTAADVNTTTMSATLEDFTDSKMNFPYVENFCNSQFICPPPLIPANVCVNSECFCPQVASILHGRGIQPESYKYEPCRPQISDTVPNVNDNKITGNRDAKSIVMSWLKTMMAPSKPMEECNNCQEEYYKMNVKKKRGAESSPPRRVVFELVQDKNKRVPKCIASQKETIGIEQMKNEKNVKNERLQTREEFLCVKDPNPDPCKSKRPIEKAYCCDSDGKTRVDVYYFDHGSYNHYQTTDAPPLVITEEVADKTEKHTTRFWAEIFGTIHIGFSFATSFILQLFRFLLYSICRPLVIGVIQLASDYFFKPFLVTMFNGIIQPILIFIYNVAGSLRDICDPIAEGTGYFLREFAVLIRSFRLVEVHNGNSKCQGECKCEKKRKQSKVAC